MLMLILLGCFLLVIAQMVKTRACRQRYCLGRNSLIFCVPLLIYSSICCAIVQENQSTIPPVSDVSARLNTPSMIWYTEDAEKKINLHVALFLSSTCPHCQQESSFFKQLEEKTPWLIVERHFINENKADLLLFTQLVNATNIMDIAVPAVFFCDSHWIGFQSPETTGKGLLKALKYCKHRIEKQKTLTPASVTVLRHWAQANQLSLMTHESTPPLQYLLGLSFLDIINPCSLFCFLAFWAILFLPTNTARKAFSGLLFLILLGSLHYFEQTHSALFFGVLSWLRIPGFALGLMSVYLLWMLYQKKYPPAYLWYPWMCSFVLVTQMYQQNCTMNLVFTFQYWLDTQSFSAAQKNLLQAGFQLLYVLPPTLLFLFYLLFSGRPWFSQRSETLALFGGLAIGTIALFLMIYPVGLSYFYLSFFIMLGLIALSAVWRFNSAQQNKSL